MLNLFTHHLAPASSEQRNRVHIWEWVLNHLLNWRALHPIHASLRRVLCDRRQRVLNRLVGVLVDHPVRLHGQHVILQLVHKFAHYRKKL